MSYLKKAPVIPMVTGVASNPTALPNLRMKPPVNPNFPTTPILILILCSSIVVLGIGVFGINAIRNELITGRAYSLGVVFGDATMIDKISSPHAYWALVGFHILSSTMGITLGPLAAIFGIRAYFRKWRGQ